MSQNRQYSSQDKQRQRRPTPDSAGLEVSRHKPAPDVRRLVAAAGDTRVDRPVRQRLVQQLGATAGNQAAQRLLADGGLIQRDDLPADEPLIEKTIELELMMETADYLRVRFPPGTSRDAVRRVYFGNPNNEARIISFQKGRAAAKISQGQFGLGIYAAVALPQFIWDRYEGGAGGSGPGAGAAGQAADDASAGAQNETTVAPEEPVREADVGEMIEEPAGSDISAMSREQLVEMVQAVRDKDEESQRLFNFVSDQQLKNERRFSKEALRALYLKMAAVSDDTDLAEAQSLYDEISRGRWRAE